MSLLTIIVSSIASTIPSRSSEDDGPTGAAAVRSAVSELEDLQDKEFEAILGEPDIIVPEDKTYFKDPKVVIPLYDVPYDANKSLVFDLPEGREDYSSLLLTLLEVFDLDLDTMEQLETKEVPVEFIGGNATVVWQELGLDKFEKGTETHPWEEDDVDDVVLAEEDEDEDELQEAEDVDLEVTDDGDDSGVNVEEETFEVDGEGEDDA